MAGIFIAAQFVRPPIDHPPVTAELNAPPEVKAILRRSCYNCHSNETKLSWFDQVAPAYWLVASDVKQARAHLNFSEIASKPAGAQKALLYEAVNQVRLGGMPLPSYRMAHPDAALTADEIATLENYLYPGQPAADPAQAAAARERADQNYDAWVHTQTQGSQPVAVPPEPNGVAFFPDYRDWKVVSTTDRFDNDTLRVILGNDVAMRAIASGQIHPWPDGAAFAKVGWEQAPDADGVVHAGQFRQVEFMVKDSRKYASTLGWGFGRWIGMDHKPYGKSGFDQECVGCHRPLRGTDYVYTQPLRGQQ